MPLNLLSFLEAISLRCLLMSLWYGSRFQIFVKIVVSSVYQVVITVRSLISSRALFYLLRVAILASRSLIFIRSFSRSCFSFSVLSTDWLRFVPCPLNPRNLVCNPMSRSQIFTKNSLLVWMVGVLASLAAFSWFFLRRYKVWMVLVSSFCSSNSFKTSFCSSSTYFGYSFSWMTSFITTRAAQ